MSKAMFTCQEATQLIVQKSERQLLVADRFKLWLHLQMCRACKRFNIQNTWIDTQLHKLSQHNHTLPSECKNRIAEELKKVS